MKTEVDVWLALAKQTKAAMEQAISGFQALSSSYEDIRDIAFNDDEGKEAIGQHYSEVNEARDQFAALAAGGGKKRRHRTRKHKGRK